VQQSLQTEFGYYFICRDNLQADAIIQQFKQWLLQAFASRASSE
jgi:hypothetical protein